MFYPNRIEELILGLRVSFANYCRYDFNVVSSFTNQKKLPKTFFPENLLLVSWCYFSEVKVERI